MFPGAGFKFGSILIVAAGHRHLTRGVDTETGARTGQVLVPYSIPGSYTSLFSGRIGLVFRWLPQVHTVGLRGTPHLFLSLAYRDVVCGNSSPCPQLSSVLCLITPSFLSLAFSVSFLR